MRTPQHGFTLIEMLIASAIAAILAATAYPSFTGVLLKARRSDGIVSLMQIQMSQERSYSNQRRYVGLADLGIPAISQQRHYRLSVVNATASGFVATAAADGMQSSDTRCRVLRIVVADGQAQYASGEDDHTRNISAENRRCWNL